MEEQRKTSRERVPATTRLRPEDVDQLRADAQAADRSVSWMIAEIVREHYQRRAQGAAPLFEGGRPVTTV